MTFSFRAAIGAAAILAVALGIGASAPGMAVEAEKTPIQAMNVPETEMVPTMAEQLAALEAEATEPLITEEKVFSNLADVVAAQEDIDGDAELNCLATGVYFEAKGEPLEGQLAVAEVIINRTQSGRFPKSVCGVLKQPGQFSFVRGGRIPQPPASARAWKIARAVAQVARKEAWDSRVSDALYFHANYVSPGWRRPRVGSIGNHIFYR